MTRKWGLGALEEVGMSEDGCWCGLFLERDTAVSSSCVCPLSRCSCSAARQDLLGQADTQVPRWVRHGEQRKEGRERLRPHQGLMTPHGPRKGRKLTCFGLNLCPLDREVMPRPLWLEPPGWVTRLQTDTNLCEGSSDEDKGRKRGERSESK